MNSFLAVSHFAGRYLTAVGTTFALLAVARHLTLLCQWALADVSATEVLLQDPESIDALVRPNTPVELHRLSPYVEHRAFLYALPAVRELHGRVRVVERVARSRQLPVRHLVQLIQGSTFLRGNPATNDLRYMLGVHLGRVRLDPSQPVVAAEEVLSRIEEYLQVTRRVLEHYSAPELAVLELPVLENGKLRGRADVMRLLSASLAEVGQGKEQRLLVERRDGLGVPNVLSAEESYIHEIPHINLLSNSLRSREAMFAGIRRVQMVFFFYCRLEVNDGSTKGWVIEDFPFHPTVLSSGRILKMENQLFGTVPVDTVSAGFLSDTALSSPEKMVRTRFELARSWLTTVERYLGIRNTPRALKWLKQVQSALAPGLDWPFSSRLEDAVAKHLSGNDVLSCREVVDMAQNVRLVLGQPRLTVLYGTSGDLQKTLRRAASNLDELVWRHPRLRSAEADALLRQTDELRDRLADPVSVAGNKDSEALLRAVEEWGWRCGWFFAPKAITVEKAFHEILALLEESGIRSLPVYGLRDGTVGVPSSEAARLGLQQDLGERIVAAGGPALEYRLIEDDELPRDAEGKVLPVSDRLWLTLGDSAAERERLEKLKAALKADWLNFARVPRTASTELRSRGRELLLERYGEVAAEAWNRSTTGGDGLLALAGTEVKAAEVLLHSHMKIIVEIDAAVEIVPLSGNGDEGYRIALKRALRTSSERILEALAVRRTSGGRRGLSVSRAKLAQEEFSLLLSVLNDLAAGGGRLLKVENGNQGRRTFFVSSRSGSVTMSLSREAQSGTSSAVELKVSAEKDGALFKGPLLRLRFSPRKGAVWQLVFPSFQMDLDVHGPSPMDSFESDHTFFDGLPEPTHTLGSASLDEAGKRFSQYLEERFLPAITGDR